MYLGASKIDLMFQGNKPVYQIMQGESHAMTGYIPLGKRYAEVDYVQLDTRQCIDTGLLVTSDLSFAAEFATLLGNTCPISYRLGMLICQTGNNMELRYVDGATGQTMSPPICKYDVTSSTFMKCYWNIRNKFWIEHPNNPTTYEEAKNGIANTPANNTDTIFINTSPLNNFPAKGKYRTITFWRGGVMILNAVPCIELETNVYGFYDTVSRKFMRESNGAELTGGVVIADGRKFN